MVKISALKSDSEPAPVLWMCHDCGGADQLCPHGNRDAPLYTSPPKREWVGLTDEEIGEVISGQFAERNYWVKITKALESKLKEKNT